MLKDAASNFTLPSAGPAKLDPVVAPPSHRVSFTEVATSERVSHSSIASFNLPLDVPLRRVSYTPNQHFSYVPMCSIPLVC